MTAILAANWSAPVASAAGSITIGQCVVNTSSGFVVATSANRTSYGRPSGIAFTNGDTRTAFSFIEYGPVPSTVSGLGAGTASPLRVSSAGALERVTTPSSSDDVVGYCWTDGSAHVAFGVLTHRTYVDSGGGGGTPGGSSGDVQVNTAGSFAGVSPSTSGNLLTSNGSAWVSTAPSFAASVITSGTLATARGGLATDVSASSGVLKFTTGTAGFITLASGIETWLTTPSGANLASALTSALPNTKGGTGQDSSAWTGLASVSAGTWSALTLGSGVSTWLGTPSGANLASALTTSLPNTKGGTGQDSSAWTGIAQVSAGTWSQLSVGSGVATWITTPSGANLASALTSALPTSKGGTGLTALGTNVATLLGTNLAAGYTTFAATPSSANLASLVTDETGSGLLVFATSPTLTTPQIDGGRAELDSFRVKGETTISSTGTKNDTTRAAIIRVTTDNVVITGVDATGAEHGELLEIWVATTLVTGITITHQAAGSSAANRFINPNAATMNLNENAVHQFRYDATTQRWRAVYSPF